MFAAWIGAVWAAPGLPLESESFTVDVTGDLAEIVFRQRFRNPGPAFVDATYLFPLDDDAAVDAMVLTVGDRVVRSAVLANEDARRRFRQAAAAGEVAALTEQHRPNVFSQDLSNLPPGEAIDVELHVVQPVDRVDGQWTLVLPLEVGPRFFRVEDPDEPMWLAAAQEETGVRASIDVVVHAAAPIREVGSPSHAVAPSVVGADVSVVVEDAPLTHDFVLTWRTAADAPAAGLLVAGGHAMLVIEAPLDTPFRERVPREVVWVVDTSCSMSGAPLAVAKDAMREALTSMDARDSFALLGFGGAVESMSSSPVPATPANVSRGLSFVDQLKPDGGTYLHLALQYALRLPSDPDRRRTVVLVTDGLIGYDTELLREIADRARDATFVALGVGGAPNRYLLDEMARLGGGVAAYAPFDADPAAEMQALVDAMDRPVWTGVTVDWGEGCPAHAFAPVSIPDLRPGRPVSVLARVEQGCVGEVVVHARSGAGTEAIRLSPVVVPHERALASTWARQRVADLERQWMRGEAREVEDAIRELGLSYAIVTSETSLVAVDDRSERGTTYPLLGTAPPAEGWVGDNANLGGGVSQRSWSLGEQHVTDPVSGTFLANYDADAIRTVASLLDGLGSAASTPDDSPAPLGRVVAPDRAPVTDRLTARAEVAGVVGPDRAGHVAAAASGPVVPERLWLVTSARFAEASLGGIDSHRARVDGELVAQPTSAHRLRVRAGADPSTAGSPAAQVAWGGGTGSAEWEGYPRGARVGSSVRAEARALGEARRDSLGGAVFASRPSPVDVLGSAHRLEVEARGTTWARSVPGRALRVAAAEGSAHDEVSVQSNLTVDAGVGVHAVERAWYASPHLAAAWDPWSDGRVQLGFGVARTVDPARYLPPDLAARAVPITDAVGATVDVQVLGDDGWAFATGRWTRADFAFAADPSLVPVPAAPVPSIEQRVTAVELGARKVESRRWSAEVRLRLLPAVEPADDALLRDPSAPYVPGFLDAYRRWGFAARARWDVPGPFTPSIGGFARWESAIEAGGPWWLDDVLALGASVDQRLDVGRGDVVASCAVSWFERDLDETWLPLEASVLLPEVPSVAEQPPLRVQATLSYAF